MTIFPKIGKLFEASWLILDLFLKALRNHSGLIQLMIIPCRRPFITRLSRMPQTSQKFKSSHGKHKWTWLHDRKHSTRGRNFGSMTFLQVATEICWPATFPKLASWGCQKKGCGDKGRKSFLLIVEIISEDKLEIYYKIYFFFFATFSGRNFPSSKLFTLNVAAKFPVFDYVLL